MAKDLFSASADAYASFRPHYPEALYEHILTYVSERQRAWDCATGNGQAAAMLARYFREVEASDISEKQLANALQLPNIHYSLQSAESTSFPDNHFNLVTVATAYHWFNWKAFKKEVVRVTKPGAVIAVWAYRLLQSTNSDLDQLIQHFYKDITGPYWDPERKHIDEAYEHVEFDFELLSSQEFLIEVNWTAKQLLGFFSTWSAVQHYKNKNGKDPLDLIAPQVDSIFEGGTHIIHFPVFTRIGRAKNA